jgi:hypothetical protein
MAVIAPVGDWATCSPEALALNPEPMAGYDVPLPNGCWKCIGCGKFVSPKRGWNQCADCDTRAPEDYL